NGLELQNALCHDFVLRRNIRIASSRKGESSSSLDTFVQSTFGSHHACLVNHLASVLNNILHAEAAKAKSGVDVKLLRPMLMDVDSGERFGLGSSQHNDTFGRLLESEPNENQLLNQILDNPADPQTVLKDLNIDPILLLQPQQAPGSSPSASAKPPAVFNLDLPRVPVVPSTVVPGNDLGGLTELLPLPAQTDPTVPRLTRSARLFLAGTGTNPKSLEIFRGSEFFLFMNMREELRWKSSDMTSRKWVEATALYNEHLGSGSVAKRPRALSEKLGEVERTILNRIATNNFQCEHSLPVLVNFHSRTLLIAGKKDNKFWTRHCFSVALIKTES
ncbi:hypothetical protein B0H17DRAFT_853971, partial [Mycena rosella]